MGKTSSEAYSFREDQLCGKEKLREENSKIENGGNMKRRVRESNKESIKPSLGALTSYADHEAERTPGYTLIK